MNKITGIKDLDIEILSKINDEKLLKICRINKYFYYNVCDDNFLRMQLSKYPNIEKYKSENQTQKQFFTYVLNYISQLKKRFRFSYSSGDFKKQYNLLAKYSDMNILSLKSAKKGELHLLIHALNEGADITNDNIIFKAIKGGNLEIVKYLINNGCGATKIDYCMRLTCIRNKLDILKYLSEKYNINHSENLRIACYKGYYEIIKYLIKKGGDIHIYEDAPLRISCEEGEYETVKYLIEKGADLHSRENYSLRHASARGYLNIVKYLVEQGGDIHAEDDFALRYSTAHGHVEVSRYLIDQGANINVLSNAHIK